MSNLNSMCNFISTVSFLDQVVNDASSSMYVNRDMLKQIIVKNRNLKKNVCNQVLLLNMDSLKESVLDVATFSKLTTVCNFLDSVVADLNNNKFIEKQLLSQVIVKNRAFKKLLCTVACELPESAYMVPDVPPTPKDACCMREPVNCTPYLPDCQKCDGSSKVSCRKDYLDDNSDVSEEYDEAATSEEDDEID